MAQNKYSASINQYKLKLLFCQPRIISYPVNTCQNRFKSTTLCILDFVEFRLQWGWKLLSPNYLHPVSSTAFHLLQNYYGNMYLSAVVNTVLSIPSLYLEMTGQFRRHAISSFQPCPWLCTIFEFMTNRLSDSIHHQREDRSQRSRGHSGTDQAEPFI